jgi:hypothetical protein
MWQRWVSIRRPFDYNSNALPTHLSAVICLFHATTCNQPQGPMSRKNFATFHLALCCLHTCLHVLHWYTGH